MRQVLTVEQRIWSCVCSKSILALSCRPIAPVDDRLGCFLLDVSVMKAANARQPNTAAFQDILELDCCNCNVSNLWSKLDSALIR